MVLATTLRETSHVANIKKLIQRVDPENGRLRDLEMNLIEFFCCFATNPTTQMKTKNCVSYDASGNFACYQHQYIGLNDRSWPGCTSRSRNEPDRIFLLFCH